MSTLTLSNESARFVNAKEEAAEKLNKFQSFGTHPFNFGFKKIEIILN